MNILEEIAEKTKERVEQSKAVFSLAEMRARAEDRKKSDCNRCLPQQSGAEAEMAKEVILESGQAVASPCAFPFEAALAAEGLSFICEVKKASPSKGLIAPDFPYVEIAKEYERAGAAAISCLTEPYWFLGSNKYLEEIVAEVSIPVLRKDFVVDEYMIYQAKALGASAALLICSILDDAQLKAYRELCDELGLSALVEAHDVFEVERAAEAGARIIGVNNRDLKTFTVDLDTSLKLRQYAPENTLFVSESGIQTASDIQHLRDNGTDAVLIGETLMRAADKKHALDELRGLV